MKPKTSGKGSPARRRREVSVVIAPGARDTVSIDSAIRGWIVPLLVKEFLAEHQRYAKIEATCDKRTTTAVGMEDVASRHIE